MWYGHSKGVIMACQRAALIFLPEKVASLLVTIRLLNPEFHAWKWHKDVGSFLSYQFWFGAW